MNVASYVAKYLNKHYIDTIKQPAMVSILHRLNGDTQQLVSCISFKARQCLVLFNTTIYNGYHCTIIATWYKSYSAWLDIRIPPYVVDEL